jgi:oligopeptide transport system permease protein
MATLESEIEPSRDSSIAPKRGAGSLIVGMILLGLLLLMIAAGPLFSGFAPNDVRIEQGAVPPGATHWFGTDELGRDLFSRTLHGGRVSLMVALAATAVAMIVGTLYGLVSGMAGGRVDALMMRLVDILYCLPFMLLVIMLMAVFGRNWILLFVAIGLVEWLTLARVVRAEVIRIKSQPYIEVAKILGVGRLSLAFRHFLPHLTAPILVYGMLTLPSVILLESALSFLGLGIQPPDASWGSLLHDGAEKMGDYPWMLAFPAAVYGLCVLAFSLITEGLRAPWEEGRTN